MNSFLKKGIPWLTKKAIEFLEKHLKTSDNILEFGAGGSTVFFGKRVKNVISIESSYEWYENIKIVLSQHNLKNVEIIFIAPNHTFRDMYKYTIDKLEDNSFDWILVDGEFRDICARHSIPKLKPDCYMIIDNYASRPGLQKVIKENMQNWKVITFDQPGWDGNGTAFYGKPKKELGRICERLPQSLLKSSEIVTST